MPKRMLTLLLWTAVPAAPFQDNTVRLQQLQDRIIRNVLAGQLDDYISCTVPLAAPAVPSTLAATLTLLRSARGIDIDAGTFTTGLARQRPDVSGIAAAAAAAIPRDNKTPEEYSRQTREAVQALSAAIVENLAPGDVGCMMTLLPWQVAADNFGRHVADQFLAFQVVVRNLNAANPFLLHNVSLALDGGALHTGVDKVLVRGSQAYGELYDRRNFLCRLFEAAAGIAVGATSYGTRDLQEGASVFQALLLPGIEKTFPDRYAAQRNALNDLGFSSATAYSMVIPPKGSAPFVAFLPAAVVSGRMSYKRWAPEQFQVTLANARVVVAGVHIQQLHTLPTALEKP